MFKLKLIDYLCYRLNMNEKTASVYDSNHPPKNVIIPRSIIYESTEYIVIEISNKAFKKAAIKTVEFPPDSELRTIKEEAFHKSSILSIKLPSHLKKICAFAFSSSHLRTVEIPLNSELEIFEEYAFAYTKIMSFTVPPHLSEISPKCFYGCRDLNVFQIPENAELKTIGPESFYSTNIERFTIPSSVVDLQDEWCSCTKLLTQVDVSPNNP